MISTKYSAERCYINNSDSQNGNRKDSSSLSLPLCTYLGAISFLSWKVHVTSNKLCKKYKYSIAFLFLFCNCFWFDRNIHKIGSRFFNLKVYSSLEFKIMWWELQCSSLRYADTSFWITVANLTKVSVKTCLTLNLVL